MFWAPPQKKVRGLFQLLIVLAAVNMFNLVVMILLTLNRSFQYRVRIRTYGSCCGTEVALVLSDLELKGLDPSSIFLIYVGIERHFFHVLYDINIASFNCYDEMYLRT